MKKMIIRNETEKDYKAVEELHRSAFWNLSAPGCNEHYLAHILRSHEDFIPELDLASSVRSCRLSLAMLASVRFNLSLSRLRTCLAFSILCCASL